MVLSLEDVALNPVLELDETDISKDNEVDIIIARSDRIFAQDEKLENYAALEAFKTFKRLDNMKIRDYLD